MNGMIAVVVDDDPSSEAGHWKVSSAGNGCGNNGGPAIKENGNGTSAARGAQEEQQQSPHPPSIIACDKGRYENNIGKKSNTSFVSTKEEGESGSRVNDPIRDDDDGDGCSGDKNGGEGKVEVKSFPENPADSKTFPATVPTSKLNSNGGGDVGNDDALVLVKAEGSYLPSSASSSPEETKREKRKMRSESGNVNAVYADDDDGESCKNGGRRNNEDGNEGGIAVPTAHYSKQNYSRQFFAAFAANFGALALGTVLAWTSPALPDLRERKSLGEISTEEETWISAIALLGAASACPIVGFGIERFGRRRCLLLLNAPFLLGWGLITLAQNIGMIYVGRLLTGFAAGGGSIAIPVYVTETASANIRGMLASGFDMMITVGILYAFVVGTFIPWEWQAAACGLIPILFHILMLFVPESPMYLVKQGRNPDASNALQWLRGAESSQQVEIELEELISSVRTSQAKSSTWRDLLDRAALKPVVLAVSLMVFQQLAPTDAILFFTVDIFASSGADVNENLSANIVGAVQVVATITAAMVVDHGGRRLLLLLSEFFMVLSLGTMGAFFYLKQANGGEVPDGLGWLPLASLMVYVVAFSVGMGPLPWLLMGELLPLHIKGKASGIVTITRWLLGFSITFLFQHLMQIIGNAYCYWVFSGCCLVGGVFVLIFVPETKGKSLDEIQEYFASPARRRHSSQIHSNPVKHDNDN